MPGVKSKEVTIYTTDICPYCTAAKNLLKEKGIEYKEINVTDDDDKREWLLQKTGQRTVPQIFFDDEPIGGYSDLADLEQKGLLQQKLRACG
ncbi:MAG: glutaredoxin 3 [Myxococcota bacterium]